jgi:geranylgeranyl pyrophosphate synthase/predicted secreted hydrolase
MTQLLSDASPAPSFSIDTPPSVHPCSSFPADWPISGEIDLAIHDLPHKSSTIEWWYVNAHLTSQDDREFSLFASFFRLALGRNEETQEYNYAHSVTWAICDVANQKYYVDSLVDASAPQVGLSMLDSGDEVTDPLLARALREVFEKGNVPLPDRLLPQPAWVNPEALELDFGGNRLVKLADGRYQLTLQHTDTALGCEICFMPKTATIRHGDDGVVRGNAGEDMFYYFIPQCQVEGSVTIAGETLPIEAGSGWYDHEFGKPTAEEPEGRIKHNIAWNWISAQLSNGYQISGYDLFDQTNQGQSAGRWILVIDPDGNSKTYETFSFTPLETWTSTRTFNNYPVAWHLEIPEAQITLTAMAEFPSQEFITILSKPAFWEGRIQLTGDFGQTAVTGLGFVERSGFDTVKTLPDFFKSVTRETRKAIEALLPLQPTPEQFCSLVASPERAHYLEGLDQEQYVQTVIQPIRDVIDRGGKSWRSYAALACLDLVGSDSQKYVDWLAWPELLHTGSLIVDDVQDRSDIRRGGVTCHQVYGEAIAINAGNAAYFLGQRLLLDDRLSVTEKQQVYELYFETLRAAHAGQAIDISGFESLMPSVIQAGTGELLEQRVLAVHRLKSAVPASSLARLGAILGGGSSEQIRGLENFFEALGLAFQIIDDVLNLRGFEQGLKSTGEDITAGKVTFPIAKAMSRLELADREALWNTIAAKPTDHEVIAEVIAKLEQCGAIAACVEQANELVETAWQKLDALLPDSAVKLRLRAFGWYVLERHY